MSQYKLIFTNKGLQKKQNAELNNDSVNITRFAVGDGVIANLVPTMTTLVSERFRALVGNVDTKNGTTIFDLIVPSNVGGFYIREVALFDEDDDCIMIGTVPVTYKVNQDEGSSKSVHLKVSTISTNMENITFETDDSVVYATVSYVNSHINDKDDPHNTMEKVNIELEKKVSISDVINTLTSLDETKPLSAKQGNVLKSLIDNINTIIASDDSTLDEIQELVNFIKQNRNDLDTLTIGNIAGLVDELNKKAAFNHNHTTKTINGQSIHGAGNIETPNTHRPISNSVTSSAETVCASLMAVKTAYDLALEAFEHRYIVSSSYGENGYRKWSDGFIEQWGTAKGITNATNKTFNFPIGFSNNCLNLTGQIKTTSTSKSRPLSILKLQGFTATQFTVRAESQYISLEYTWFAVGY